MVLELEKMYDGVWMGPRRSQVVFWRLFPQSDFKKKLIGKSIRGYRGSTRCLQEDAERNFEGVKVGGKGR